MTVSEAEAAYPGYPRKRGAEKPFGFENARWEALKAAMREGDDLYAFCTSPESWRALAGAAGIALVRDGRRERTGVRAMRIPIDRSAAVRSH
jgi:hypothetical protein